MMEKKMGGVCMPHKVGMALLVLGGLHLGLWSAFGIDIPTKLFGPDHIIPWIVNILIGISALMTLMMSKCCMKGGMCGSCSGGTCATEGGKTCSCGTCDMCKGGSCKGGECKAGGCKTA